MKDKPLVTRVTLRALEKLLTGWVEEDNECVIKFYSPRCHYCKLLAPPYHAIAEKYDKVSFMAFNVFDVPEEFEIGELVELNGVPTIIKFKTGPFGKPSIHTLQEPAEPNEYTWYWPEDIETFINEEF